MKLVLVVIVIAALAFGAYALGLFTVGTSGDLRTPQVSVSGGEIPQVEVETAKVKVGTRELSVDVPTVELDRAGDNGKADE